MKNQFTYAFLLATVFLVAQKKLPHTAMVIRNVNVISMTIENKIIRNASVLVKGNKIISINQPIPDSAEVIDGTGKWLIPGLIDMHVHIPVDGHFNTTFPTRAAAIFTNTQDVMTPFIVNGVTTVFELNSRAAHFGQRNEILRGDVIGPRMALAAMINGGSGEGRIASTAADGRQTVRLAKAEGYEFIKVYSQLNIETFRAILDEASKLGMKVVGHIPNEILEQVQDCFTPKFGMVAHAEELFKVSEKNPEVDAKFLAELAEKNGTWLIPTLVIIESAVEQSRSIEILKQLPSLKYVHPLLQNKWISSNNYYKNASGESISRLERMIEFNSKLVSECKKAGVPIVTGTDAGSSGVIWGFSLHDELELLVSAGLTTEDVLKSATLLPATWLGVNSIVGTIEVGKLADMVLLDANPLDDIKNVRKIAGVLINGTWLNKQKIQELLTELAHRNAISKEQFQWSKKEEY